MAQVSTYLNFQRNTEEAFNFYKTVFGSEFKGSISRFRWLLSFDARLSPPNGGLKAGNNVN